MDWFAKASVTHRRSLLWFRSNLTHQKLTDILNDLPILNCCSSPFFFFFWKRLFCLPLLMREYKVKLGWHQTLLSFWDECSAWQGGECVSIWSLQSPFFCFLFVPFSVLSPSPLVSLRLVGVFNAAIVTSQRAGGGSWDPRPPPNNGHMLPPLWDSRVCVCVCEMVGGVWWGLCGTGKHLSSLCHVHLF